MAANSSRNTLRALAREGGNPANKNRSVGRPAMVSAAITAEAPGIGNTSEP